MSLNKPEKLIQLAKAGSRPGQRFIRLRVRDFSETHRTSCPMFIAGSFVDGEMAGAWKWISECVGIYLHFIFTCCLRWKQKPNFCFHILKVIISSANLNDHLYYPAFT
jgi:hypothetical protein